jgi:hypothetical protein
MIITYVLFFASFCLIIYNIFFKKNDTIVYSPTTTTIIPLPTPITTTTFAPTTTTSAPITTTTKPPRTIYFSSLNSGGLGGRNGGGGGAGGIIINNDTSKVAGVGQSSMSVAGGNGGKGYGAGGGGGGPGLTIFKGEQQFKVAVTYTGGVGTQGFVYIVEEDKLFTTNTQNYIPKYVGTYTFIIMGGGGCGAPGFSTSGYPGNGGDAGQIIIKKVRGIASTTLINITIGQGGKNSNLRPQIAGNTTVSCVLGASTVDIVALGASPGESGSTTNKQAYTIQSMGGRMGSSGGIINQSIIDNMNSNSPTET